MRRNDKQPRLNKNLNPVPTIQPPGVYEDKPSCLPSIPKARKPPKQRVFQPDQQPQYESTFVVESFEDINESLLELRLNAQPMRTMLFITKRSWMICPYHR